MGLFEEIASGHPDLKRKLIMAKMNPDPVAYARKTMLSAIWISSTIAFALFLCSTAFDISYTVIIIMYIVSLFIIYHVLFRIVDVRIQHLAKDIDREVLFAGRFLLVKLNAGRPLIVAFSEASKSYGVASKHFQEIVHDIDVGTPLEEALSKASRYSPSEKFRHILFQISNALRIGVDVTNTLEAVLNEIADEQLVEIQRYGHKLSSLTMFYMLLAIVIPSLGITLFVTLVSMLSVEFDLTFFLLLAGVIFLIELVFMTVFKSIRPNVNI